MQIVDTGDPERHTTVVVTHFVYCLCFSSAITIRQHEEENDRREGLINVVRRTAVNGRVLTVEACR